MGRFGINDKGLELHLVRRGLRPFPEGHSLPPFIPLERYHTRCVYEGEPRELPPFLCGLPGGRATQYWAPFWVDLIVKVFSGAVGDEDERSAELALAVRNAYLKALLDSKERRAQLMSVYRLGGLDAVAKLCGLVDAPEVVKERHDGR